MATGNHFRGPEYSVQQECQPNYDSIFANARPVLSFPDGSAAASKRVKIQKKVSCADKGIIVDDRLRATISRHKRKVGMDVINVAPGMDILIALGLSWIRAKQSGSGGSGAIAGGGIVCAGGSGCGGC